MRVKVLLLALLLAVLPEIAFAQIPDLNSLLPPGNGSTSGRIIQLMALITVLSVAPGLLIMVTSFVRIAVVLSLLPWKHGQNFNVKDEHEHEQGDKE